MNLFECKTSPGLATLMNPPGSGVWMVVSVDGTEVAKLMPGSWICVADCYLWEEHPLPRPLSWWKRLLRWLHITR